MKSLNSKSFAVALSAIFLSASVAFAHPPSKIETLIEGDKLTVTLIHDVKDPAKHYIEEVVVKLNGNKVIDKKETRQLDNDKQIEVFEITGLKSGDEISIKGTCNKFGSKTEKIKIQ